MKKNLKIETRNISSSEYRNLKILKKSAVSFFKISNEMIIHIGRVAELELCYLMEWELCEAKQCRI